MSLNIGIRIHCNWANGKFNVRATGEGRWGLNVAQMLMDRGYNLILIPNWPIKEEWLKKNVVVVSAKDAHKYGSVDLYIDPAWSFRCKTYIKAKHILATVWFLHKTLKVPCPNMTYHYPYDFLTHYNTLKEIDGHKILCWPAPFGKRFIDYNDTIRTEVLYVGRHLQFSDQLQLHALARQLMDYLKDKCNCLHIINTEPEKARKYVHYTTIVKLYNSLKYDVIKNLLNHSKLHISLGHSSVLDSVFQGAPPVLIENRLYGNVPFVKQLGLLVKPDRSNILDVLDTLLYNQKIREEYLQCFQDYFHPHLEENSFYYFQRVLESLGLKDN